MNDRFVGEFFSAYLVAAIWEGTDEDSVPLDRNFDITHFAPEALDKMRSDCEKFISENQIDLSDVKFGSREYSNAEMAGHNFLLTRNRCGTGFWDRDLGEAGDRLTEASHKFGEQDLYIGDDGLIYC